jgi:hypothetical protein
LHISFHQVQQEEKFRQKQGDISVEFVDQILENCLEQKQKQKQTIN